MPNISVLKESNYLQKSDVEPPVLVTIKGDMVQENIAKEGQPEDLKWCLYFQEYEKPLIVNSTNGQLIAKALGSEESSDWDGKQIVLYNDPNVSFGGKLTGGIRVRAKKKSKEVRDTDPDEDNIPF